MEKINFKPVNMRVDLAKGDMPVTENKTPLFSWAALHSGENQRQSEYRITAERDAELIWDSGFVKSPEQRAVYAGRELRNNDIVLWRLTIKDKDGNMSDTAEQSFLVSFGENFDAPWISPPDYEQRNTYHFIRRFKAKGKIKRTVLSVCGLGIHEVYINGAAIDNDMFNPVFSNYDKLIYYCVRQTDGFVFEGENCIDILVADGWRNNTGKWSVQMLENHPVPLFGEQVLSAKLDMYYADGSHDTVRTDEKWSVVRGSIKSNLFEGEEYDENIEFSEKAAVPAQVVQKPGGSLHPQTCESEKIQEIYRPVAIVRSPDGGFIADFGVNLAGVCEVKIPAEIDDGRRIVLRHAEMLNDDFTLYTENLRSALSVDVYITKRGLKRQRVWRPHFTYHGFRYVHISGLDFADEDTICAAAVYSGINKSSRFACSDSLVNDIQKAIVLTEKNNIHGMFTDCPQRDERMGWMNDAAVRFEQLPYNFETAKLFNKVIADCVSEQDEQGRITCTAPYFFGCRPADPVCSAFMAAADENLMHCGDRETIKRYYSNFKAWNEFLKTISKDNIIEYSLYGDWAGPADSCISFEDPHSCVTPAALMSTGYYYYNYKLLAKFAAVIGDTNEADCNLDAAERVKKAFTEKWIDEETGIAAGGSQGAQAFALWLDILPPKLRDKAAAALNMAVIENNYRFTAGNLTAKRVLEMLFEYGYEDTAFELISSSEYPSIGYMLKRGATTIWERFEDKKQSAMNSHNHPMYGAVGSCFYEYLAGIMPLSPGFERVRIKPYFPKKLDFVQAAADTVKGRIYCEWRRCAEGIHIYVQIPFGVTAEIHAGAVHKVGSGFHHFIINNR